MLIVEGFLENGVFIPNKPLVDVKGRQHATLTIKENCSTLQYEETERQEWITAWRQFGEAVLTSNEKLDGEPERFRFRTIEDEI